MTEVINKYETIFIVDSSLEEDKMKETVKKFTDLIEKSATIESVDEWGKRRLAYEINDRKEGYYVLVNFSAKPDFPSELDRIYRITDGVLRSIIIKKDEK
jgi:small subunit ribosomal protein S6